MRGNRDFNLFWVMQTLSAAGSSFSSVAIPLLVLQATGSVAQMGLVTGAAGLASIGAGVFAGVLVDRVDRRALLIGCDAVRAVAYALIPLVWLASPQLWLVYAVVPLGAVLAMVFQVGYVTVVPNLVSADRITQANGRLYASYAAAGVVGPMLAGVVSGLFGPATAIGIDAITFGVSALGLCFVRFRPRSAVQPAAAESAAEPVAASRASWRDLLVGVRFLWQHPVLRTLTVLLSLLTFLSLGLTDLVIYRVKHDLGQSDAVVGYATAAGSVGVIVAALVVAPARRRLGFGTCWIGSQVLCGTAVACVGLTDSVAVLALLGTSYFFGISTAGICSMSLRQEVTPDHLLGRVTSAFWTIHSALGPIGAAVLTAAAARYGVPAVCLVAGAAVLVIAVGATFTPVRQRRPEQLAPVYK